MTEMRGQGVSWEMKVSFTATICNIKDFKSQDIAMEVA